MQSNNLWRNYHGFVVGRRKLMEKKRNQMEMAMVMRREANARINLQFNCVLFIYFFLVYS